MNACCASGRVVTRRRLCPILAIILLAVGNPVVFGQEGVPTGAGVGVGVGVGTDGVGDGRTRILNNGMRVLGSWAGANIVGGLVGLWVADDEATAGFWEMNAWWNTVNAVLAVAAPVRMPQTRTDVVTRDGASWLRASEDGTVAARPFSVDDYRPDARRADEQRPGSRRPGSRRPDAYSEESHRLEKVFWVNVGLNVAYMTAGAWMWERWCSWLRATQRRRRTGSTCGVGGVPGRPGSRPLGV